MEAEGRMGEASRAYEAALGLDAGLVPAAHRLARLWIARGEPVRALAVSRRTLLVRPDCAPCWSDGVLARLRMGDREGARRTADEALARGIALDPDVAAELRAQAGP